MCAVPLAGRCEVNSGLPGMQRKVVLLLPSYRYLPVLAMRPDYGYGGGDRGARLASGARSQRTSVVSPGLSR